MLQGDNFWGKINRIGAVDRDCREEQKIEPLYKVAMSGFTEKTSRFKSLCGHIFFVS